MTTVAARAPAKVNVQLAVGPLRSDGFHELRTVYLAVSLFDTVTVRGGEGLRVSVTGLDADVVPTDRRNLVWRAAELLAEHAGVRPDAAIEIDKSIPAAAGLAGGSADAAAALVALDALWATGAAREDLDALAAQLGSDVPFSLLGGVALGAGRGRAALAGARPHAVGLGARHRRRRAVHARRLRGAGPPAGGRQRPRRGGAGPRRPGDRGAAQRAAVRSRRRARQRPAGPRPRAASRARSGPAGGRPARAPWGRW